MLGKSVFRAFLSLSDTFTMKTSRKISFKNCKLWSTSILLLNFFYILLFVSMASISVEMNK